MIRWLVKTSVWIYAKIFYRHKIYGKEHLTKGGGIIASNHCSFLDPPMVGISCPGVVHFLARDTLFRFPPFAWLIRKLKTHPVKRGKGNVHAFKLAMDLVMSGGKVVIFPEGRRSPNGELQEGQAGVGMLVLKTRCRVFPVYVHGTYKLWNVRRRFPKLIGKTACIFGSALDFSKMGEIDKKQAQQEMVTQIMEAIARLKEWYLNGAHGSPP